jgi:[ribosomal protein S5]-alanine N-acetyltransferase
VSHTITTERLELVPMRASFLRACLAGEFAAAAAQLRVALPDDWFDAAPVFELRLRQLEADPSLAQWLLRAMVHRQTRQMVGYIGFHTAPGAPYLREWSPGGVEFGLSVFAPQQRKGFGREAALALMEWAEHTHGVRSFVATVGPANLASQALFARLGFVKVGSHVDEEDGPEDVLVREVPSRIHSP